MGVGEAILSDITVYTKYARHLAELKRRETWGEISDRNRLMHERRYPSLKDEIRFVYKLVEDRKTLPSMRSMQYGGLAIEKNPARMYNCAYVAVDTWKVFNEVMFLHLCGSGVGYSVQHHHVDQLPPIRRPTKTRRFLVSDSIEGWADAIRALTKAFFFGATIPDYDFSDIRPAGSILKTSGGHAPGPGPLQDTLHHIRRIFEQKAPGEKLRPIEAHDIMCWLAEATSNGGVRAAAMISLFSMDDEEMLTAKYGNFWDKHPQRQRANNSAVILRHRVKRPDFGALWQRIQLSGRGEPGLYFSNDADWGTNPCCEVALRSAQMCNLTEVNVSDVTTQDELNRRVRAGAFLGTLQAGYTDFHYLRDTWRTTCEKDALIGVGMTGIACGGVLGLDLGEAAAIVLEENERVAALIGIRPAARTTLVKPAGNSACVLHRPVKPVPSGIHAFHAQWFLRRMWLEKVQPLYKHLAEHFPELIEDHYFKPKTKAVITIPIAAPEGAALRSESAITLLERVKQVSTEWVRPGHRTGHNTHNVSCTVTVKPDEWERVGDWMWDNRDHYNGLAVLPYDGGQYVQAPFEEITKDEYDARVKTLRPIDLTKVIESDDNTTLEQQVACAGGACEIA